MSEREKNEGLRKRDHKRESALKKKPQRNRGSVQKEESEGKREQASKKKENYFKLQRFAYAINSSTTYFPLRHVQHCV